MYAKKDNQAKNTTGPTVPSLQSIETTSTSAASTATTDTTKSTKPDGKDGKDGKEGEGGKEDQVSSLERRVSELTKLVGELSISMKTPTQTSQSPTQVSTTDEPGTQERDRSIDVTLLLSGISPKANAENHVMLGSPATYKGRTGSTENSNDGIEINGQEEACKLINEIRKEIVDNNNVENLSYIQNPSEKIERAFIAVHSTLATKVNKTPNDEMVLNRYDILKFPGPKSKDMEGFFHWFKRLIWYKHVNCIPDYLLRDDIISAAVLIHNQGLENVVRAACKKPDEIEYGPIKYQQIFLMWQRKNTQDASVDLVGAVNRLMKLGDDPMSTMITILIEIENYLSYNKLGDLPIITWVRLFKTLYDNQGHIMQQIFNQMDSRVKLRKLNDEGKLEDSYLNGELIRQCLLTIEASEYQELLGKKLRASYDDIWQATNATFNQKIPMISFAKPNSKVRKDTKNKCDFCGKQGHIMTICYKAQNAVKNKEIIKKDGKLCMMDGKELQIAAGETIMLKYPELFKNFARQRTQTTNKT